MAAQGLAGQSAGRNPVAPRPAPASTIGSAPGTPSKNDSPRSHRLARGFSLLWRSNEINGLAAMCCASVLRGAPSGFAGARSRRRPSLADASCYAPAMKLILAALLLLIAAPAMAQSMTVILPEPDGGYLVVPPSGQITQVLPQPSGGALVVTPGRPSTIVLPLPEGSAATVPFSAAEPCCPGLPGLPDSAIGLIPAPAL